MKYHWFNPSHPSHLRVSFWQSIDSWIDAAWTRSANAVSAHCNRWWTWKDIRQRACIPQGSRGEMVQDTGTARRANIRVCSEAAHRDQGGVAGAVDWRPAEDNHENGDRTGCGTRCVYLRELVSIPHWSVCSRYVQPARFTEPRMHDGAIGRVKLALLPSMDLFPDKSTVLQEAPPLHYCSWRFWKAGMIK